MYYVVMDRTSHRIDILRQPTTREKILAEFADADQATRYVAAAVLRVTEFKREVASASHHLNKQLATLAWQIKEQKTNDGKSPNP